MSAEHNSPRQSKGEKVTDITAARPKYEAPSVTQMSEKDVLRSFQVTSAASTWWSM